MPITAPLTLLIEKPHSTMKYYRKLCMFHLAVGLLRTSLHHDGSIQVFVQLFAQKLVGEVTWSKNKTATAVDKDKKTCYQGGHRS